MANERQLYDFMFTSGSNHGSTSLGFRDIDDVQYLRGFMTGPFLVSISFFIFSFFISLFCLVPGGRLS